MMFSIKSLSLGIGLVFLALPSGCGAAVEPAQSASGPKLPDPGADQQYEVRFPDPGHGVARYIGLTIDEGLSRSCGLMRTYFDFDSAELSPQDKADLRAVAQCLDRPELASSKLSIVGRTDARGGAAYNEQLGRERAESVKKLLISAGIAESRISIASRGDSGAMGTNAPSKEYSHGYDRRVDVVLVGVLQAPQ